MNNKVSEIRFRLTPAYSTSPTNNQTDLHKQVRPRCLVGSLQFPAWWPDFLQHQWKLDFGVVELLSTLPLAKFSRDCGSLNDLDAMATDPVARSHLGVHVLNSTIQSSITVLLVHVVITSSTLIPQPDTIVLDLCWVLLKNLQANQVTYKET